MTDQTPDDAAADAAAENNGKPAPRAPRGFCRRCGAAPLLTELLPRQDGTAAHLPTHLRAVGGGAVATCGPVVTSWHYAVSFVDQAGRPGRTFLKLNFELAHAEQVEAIEKRLAADLPKKVAVDRQSGAPIVGLEAATENRVYVMGWVLMRVESADVWLRAGDTRS